MRANELRLNNWVYSQEIGDNVQISAISEDSFSFKDCVTWGYPNIEEIQPISITEEILLKCGFEILPDGKVNHDSLSDFETNFIFNSKSDIIKYLHQLQNLYFSLTQEELNIEL